MRTGFQRWGAAAFIGPWIVTNACAAAPDPSLQDADGLQVEVPDSEEPDQGFFNADNRIYLPGREFVFKYTIERDGREFRVRTVAVGDTATKNWTFVEPEKADELTIHYIGFEVLPGYGGLDDLFPDYSQTVIRQKYWNSEMSLLLDGATGLVENAANVWLHPFRGKYFSVTQLSPFPFFKIAARSGQPWFWKLADIDDRWSDPRVVEYSGGLSATYEYRIAGTKRMQVEGEDQACTIVEGVATSRLGTSRLSSCFSEKYGFVELKYANLDGSTIAFALYNVTATGAH